MVSRIRNVPGASRSVPARTFSAMLAISLIPGVLGAQLSEERHAADDLGIRWVEVEAGTFAVDSGGTQQQVTVDRFLLSATEITFAQYDAFCNATGKRKPDDSGWGRGTRPVHNVSYDDAVEFCRWLSRESGDAVRLPNEIEWEYAARGGCHGKGYRHSGGDDKDEVSWNEDNSGNRTHPVGTKRPNELDLHDMSGNLWEWCADWPGTIPGGPEAGSRNSGHDAKHAVRGDSYDNPGSDSGPGTSVRIHGDSRHTNIGFRIAKST